MSSKMKQENMVQETYLLKDMKRQMKAIDQTFSEEWSKLEKEYLSIRNTSLEKEVEEKRNLLSKLIEIRDSLLAKRSA
jgi:hypothetical protein